MTERVEDYQQSEFYSSSLKICPWKDTDHMGERLHNYCTWCEGYVAGAESREEQLTEMADMFAKVERRLGWFTDELMCRFEPSVGMREGMRLLGRRFVDSELGGA